jgi:DNA-binding GntR family transcriptional regulator
MSKSRSLSALKTSLLGALMAGEGSPLVIARLADECGVTRRAVYEALGDLNFSGLIRPDVYRSARLVTS